MDVTSAVDELLDHIMDATNDLAVQERIIRCRDCKHEFEEWGYPYCCRKAPTVVFEVDGDGFCKWAEPRSE